ncbi:MAG: ABC transporter ATP-binding protein [Candidatus Binatia bacterium]
MARVRLNPLFRELRTRRLLAAARELRPYLSPVKQELAFAVLCSIGGVLMVTVRPWPIKMVLDYAILPAGRVKWRFPYYLLKGYGAMGVTTIACGLLIAVTLLWGLFVYTQRYLVASAGQKVTFDLRRQLFSHLQRQSIAFHRQQRVGDLLLRATGDTNMLREMVVDATFTVLTEFLVLAAMLGVMLYMDWQLTMVSLAVLPLLGLTVFRISGNLRAAVRTQRKNDSRVATRFGEMLQGVAVIQAFGREAHEEDRFKGSNRQSLRAGLRTVRLEANLQRVAEVLIAVGTGAVLWLGVRRVLAGILTPGDLVVFTHYLAGMYRPIRRVARVTGRISKATICADRVFAVLREDRRVKVHRDALPAPHFHGRVTFKQVSFSYHPGTPVLRDVSLTLLPGQTVAIVGPNGSGKSTLCALLPRLFDPAAGTITIDGEKVNRFTLESVRAQIGVVLQEPLLFAGSIGENIAYGKPEATREEIMSAARAASAHDFIMALPDGYDTVVGERGGTLSGGERQKIAIARAMIKDPSVLVLDEPTAALDATSAVQVNVALARLSHRRTTLRVSHRLAEVRDADLIAVLRDGVIAQRGSHEELIAEPGWYRSVFQLQEAEREVADDARGDAAERPAVRLAGGE